MVLLNKRLAMSMMLGIIGLGSVGGSKMFTKRVVIIAVLLAAALQTCWATEGGSYSTFIPSQQQISADSDPQSPLPVPEAAAVVLGPSGLAMILALERHRRRYQRIRDGVSLGYYMAKRAVDIILASIALILAAPLFLLIMLLVRLDSPGPVFFRRMAVGKSGKVFGMIKFRTMIVDAEQVLQADDKLREQYYTNHCKLTDDPRVTSLGKFLRKISLDELPQFLNVLAGDMTFVGPRPIAEDEVHLYGPEVERFKTVTPGITGLWQTQGRSEVSYDKRVELDMQYISRRSLVLDIWLLLCTLPAVLLKRGAF